MSIAEGKAAIDSVDSVAGWLSKAHKYFQPLRPEVKDMTINYRNKSSEISMFLNIPLGLRRRKQVEIPAYKGFTITEMMDESFGRVKEAWRFEDGMWKLDATKLPKSEKFLVKLKGNVSTRTLNSLVRIQPAVNRDQTEQVDRFWLDCMLRDAELLVEIYKELNIDDVDVNVKVDIQRTFSSSIPADLNRRLTATKRWIAAGRQKDRGELHRAWLSYRSTRDTSRVSAEEIIAMVLRLTSGETFAEFLTIDQPYRLGHIKPERFIGPFPSRVGVDVTTELGLNRQTASGFLSFKKKDFADKIRNFLG